MRSDAEAGAARPRVAAAASVRIKVLMVSSVTSPVRAGSHKDCGFGVRYTNFMFINKRLAEGLFS